MIQNYKRAVYCLKTSGICMVVVSGCWILYQVRQTTVLLNSVVPTNILELGHKKAQYIYIDDPRLKDILRINDNNGLQSSLKEKPRTLSYIVTKWWKSLNRKLAYRFFHLAQTGDKTERRKAVNSLSSLLHLRDWHYRNIAQMLDARTAVALARLPNTNLRFFLNPPYFYEEYKLYEIIDKLQNLLTKLNALCGGCHPCLLEFLRKKFQVSHRDTTFIEHDLTSVGVSVPPPIVWDQHFLFNCIHAIYHHSSLEEHSKDVADVGGLQILMNVYKLVGDNVDICALIAKILSNLSLHPEYLEDMFRSGWIGVLASWSRNKDIRLAAPASRALANLDFDDNEGEKYPQRIYPLYPLHRVDFKKKLDIIFIHGLLGGVFVTWRQRDIDTSIPVPVSKDNEDSLKAIVNDYPSEFLKDLARDFEAYEWRKLGQDYEVILHDCPVNVANAEGPFSCTGDDPCVEQNEQDCTSQTQCWPKDWLPNDVPNLRIIGINYNTNLSMWTPLCPLEGVKSTIKERSSEFTKKLVVAGVGKRSIVWACHSMGGLLVKQLLVDEWKNGDKNNLVSNTKGIVFYSTPHRGSHVAALNQTTQALVWPSVEVQELREQSPNLLRLHNDFVQMLQEHNIDIISFGETKPTRVTALKVPFRFVNPSSANPDVGEFFEIPQDHLSICKPANRQSFLYQKVLAMIKRHVRPKIEENSFLSFFEKVI